MRLIVSTLFRGTHRPRESRIKSKIKSSSVKVRKSLYVFYVLYVICHVDNALKCHVMCSECSYLKSIWCYVISTYDAWDLKRKGIWPVYLKSICKAKRAMAVTAGLRGKPKIIWASPSWHVLAVTAGLREDLLHVGHDPRWSGPEHALAVTAGLREDLLHVGHDPRWSGPGASSRE